MHCSCNDALFHLMHIFITLQRAIVARRVIPNFHIVRIAEERWYGLIKTSCVGVTQKNTLLLDPKACTFARSGPRSAVCEYLWWIEPDQTTGTSFCLREAPKRPGDLTSSHSGFAIRIGWLEVQNPIPVHVPREPRLRNKSPTKDLNNSRTHGLAPELSDYSVDWDMTAILGPNRPSELSADRMDGLLGLSPWRCAGTKIEGQWLGWSWFGYSSCFVSSLRVSGFW